MGDAYASSLPHESDARFRERVRRTLRRLLRQRPMGFEQLLTCCLNCDPAVLSVILAEDVASGAVRRGGGSDGSSLFVLGGEIRTHESAAEQQTNGQRDAWISAPAYASSSEIRSSLQCIARALPEAAPVYSQWWFSISTCFRLAELMIRLKRDATEIAFLGSPTFAAIFSQLSDMRATVFDVDTEVLRRLSSHYSPVSQLVPYDVGTELDASAAERFGLVFADPPWGRTLLRSFLRRASELASVGGAVVISFPQALTRPGLSGEIRTLLREAVSLGLHLWRVIRNATEYEVPLFEFDAYRSCGIELHTTWRRGDLLVFRKLGRSRQRTLPEWAWPVAVWEQFCVDKERLFVRRGINGRTSTLSISPVPGAIDFRCPTTSSRSSVMQLASIVSTRNEVASVRGDLQLGDTLREHLTRIAVSREAAPSHRPSEPRNLLGELGLLIAGQHHDRPQCER